MANITGGEAKYYIGHKTLTKSCIFPSSALSVLLYFALEEVLTKSASLTFNSLSTHLLKKQL